MKSFSHSALAFNFFKSSRTVVLAVAAFASSHAAAFDCDNQALQDSNGYYCGNDRASYVLHPDGVSLWVSAETDERPVVKVREKTSQGGLMERVILQYGEIVGDYIVSGVGSNPHINASGEAAVQFAFAPLIYQSHLEEATEYWHYRAIPKFHGLMVSSPSQPREVVAVTGQPLGTDTAICAEGIQPWPFVGNGGHYVFGAELQDANGICSNIDGGDADTNNNISCPEEASSLAYSGTRARVTRVVMDPGDPANADQYQSRRYTVFYELLDGQTISAGMNLAVYVPGYLEYPGRTAEQQCFTSRATWLTGTGWDHSVPGQISLSKGAWENSYICGLAGCDVDLSAFNFFVYEGNNGTVPLAYTQESTGVRAIARGRVGGAGPQTIVRAVTLPRSVADTETVVSASVASGEQEAGHPAESSGAVTYRIRRADAITHTARMVGADGSAVVSVGAQAAPSQLVFGDDADWGDTGSTRLEYGYWNRMLLHVDASGEVSVAANRRGDLKLFGNGQITSDGGVIYRSYHDRNDEDIEYRPTRAVFASGWSTGAPTGNVPTGAGAARAGTWYPTAVAIVDTSTDTVLVNNIECAYESICSLTVTSNSPSASNWSMWISSAEISGSTAETVSSLAAAGNLGLRVSVRRIYNAMLMTDEAAAASDSDYVTFALPVGAVTELGGTAEANRVMIWPLEVNKWTKTGGVTTVFANGDVSPAGFSLIRGVPKHFSEGGGVIGARVSLETPHVGSASGANNNAFPAYDSSSEASMLATILGDNDPCRQILPDFSGEGGTDWSSADDIDGGSACQAIMVSEGGALTEVARSKQAEAVFSAEDDAAETGVSGVDGFTFVEFGAAVAVSDTGSVFFNAQTRDLPDAAATDCQIGDILDQYGDNRHGVFMYRDGVVEKVIAEGDVISLHGQNAFVKAISLPQPELRAAVAGDSIMLKMAVDTDGDCIEDTVGLVQATAPSSSTLNGDDPLLFTPDRGQYASVVHPTAGNVRLVNASPDNGWQLNSFRPLGPSTAIYLSDDQMSGGLYSFTATWCKDEEGRVLQAATRPAVCPADSQSLASTTPTAPVELDLYLDVPVEDFVGVFKDLVDTPTLADLENVEATEAGIKVSIVVEDDGPFDLDADMGEAYDPFGAALIAIVLPPYVPVPVLGQGLWVLLSGLVSLFGGIAFWRRRPA